MTRLEDFYSSVLFTLDEPTEYAAAASIDNGEHEQHGVSRPEWLITKMSDGHLMLADPGEMDSMRLDTQEDWIKA